MVGEFVVRPEVSLYLNMETPLNIEVEVNGIKLDLNQSNNRHSLRLNFSKDQPGYLLWSTSIPSAGRPAASAPIVGDAIYLGADRKIYAVSKETGQVIWHYELNDSARAVGLFEDALIATDGDVYSIDSATGTFNWRFVAPSDDGRIGIQMFHDNIYAVLLNDDHIYTIDAATGRLKWNYNSDSQIYGVMAREEAFYISHSNGTLLSLNVATGKVNWRYKADDNPHLYGIRPAISGRAIYFSTHRNVYVLDKETGEELTVRHVSKLFDPDGSESQSLSIISGILSGDRLYLAASNRDVVALDYELNSIYWNYKFEREVPSNWSSGYMRHIGNDKIYLLLSPNITNDGPSLDDVDGIYTLDITNGTLLWHFGSVLGASNYTEIHEDVLYLESHDGYLETIDAVTGQLRRRFNVERMYTGIDFTISDGILYGLEGSHVFALTAER